MSMSYISLQCFKGRAGLRPVVNGRAGRLTQARSLLQAQKHAGMQQQSESSVGIMSAATRPGPEKAVVSSGNAVTALGTHLTWGTLLLAVP